MTLGFHSQQFADKVRTMNQTSSTSITLTAAEARNLLNDLFGLQNQIVALAEKITEVKEQENITVTMDGDKF